MVDLGTEGGVAEFADRVKGEIEGTGTLPGRGVVEGLVDVVGRGEKDRDRGRGRERGLPRGRGLMKSTASSGDEGGAAWEGAGAERHLTTHIEYGSAPPLVSHLDRAGEASSQDTRAGIDSYSSCSSGLLGHGFVDDHTWDS